MASPVAPWNDLFGKCTLIQMDDFKQKLEKLRDSLKDAMDQADTHEACKILRNQFGDDFPVPEKENTTKNTVQTFQTTGRSALLKSVKFLLTKLQLRSLSREQ